MKRTTSMLFATALAAAPAVSAQEVGGDIRLTELKSGEIGEIVVTGSRARPSVAVSFDQPPIEVESRLTVVFAIDQGKLDGDARRAFPSRFEERRR